MPRLPVWIGGAALAGAGYYAFYYQFYIPRHTSQRERETAVELEKLGAQSLYQRFALLRHTVESGMLSPTSPSSQYLTNRQRLSLYCELQQLRKAFCDLPLQAQTASEKQKILRDLDKLELRHCTALNFRDEALTLWQILTCQFCYSVYGLCFGLIDVVVRQLTRHCERAEWVRRQALHYVSRWLLDRLDVRVVMTVDHLTDVPSILMKDKTNSKNHSHSWDLKEEKEENALFLVFAPQHWIEVIGFWGCPTNPLLTSSRVHLLQPSWQYGISSRPRVTVLPYELYWRDRWLQMQRDLRNPVVVEGEFASIAPALNENPPSHDGIGELNQSTDEQPVISSFGYPLAPLVFIGTEEPSPSLLPVAAAGLSRLLFLDDTVARPDIQIRPNAQETYTNVHERQFHAYGGAGAAKGLPNREFHDKVTADAEATVLSHLQQWHLGCPFWHRFNWGAAYGGESRAGNRARRELTFRVGRLCYASELMSVQAELQKELVEGSM